MKLSAAAAESFLRRPDPSVVAVLIYGPDAGQVRERADALVVRIAGDAADPFRVAELGRDGLHQEPARLGDDAAQLAFGGGRRVVRVRDADDAVTAAVRAMLDRAEVGGLCVLEAAELGPRSTLRQLCEGAPRAASIACYHDEGGALRRLVTETLAGDGVRIGGEALDLLVAHLGADRAVTRRELEKLAVYTGSGTVDVDDVLAVAADAGSVSADAVAFAACGGDVDVLDRDLARALAAGTQPIPLLRAVARHLRRLVQARAAVAQGASPKQAMDGLRPAVFFRLQPAFLRQVESWDAPRLAWALAAVSEAELQCKRTGTPQGLLCHRLLFDLARLVRTPARGGPDDRQR